MKSDKLCLQLEIERSKLKDDSNSEDDCTADEFKVISDLKKDFDKNEDEYKIWRSKGFENLDKAGKIVSLELI